MTKPQRTRQLPLWSIDLAGLGVCAALTAVAFFIGIQPLLQQRAEAATARAQLTTEKRRMRDLTVAHQDLARKLAALETSLPKTEVKLLPATYLNNRLDELIQLARESKLTIDEIRPGELIELSHYNKFMIHLTGTGTYRTWTNFLSRSHRKFPDIQVQRLMLEANAETTPPTAVSQVDLVWFTALN